MRRMILCLLAMFALVTTMAHAGSGHDHGPAPEINRQQAVKKAKDIVAKLVRKGKLENSWAEIREVDVEKKDFQKGPEWVVSFNNPAIEDQAKQTLYMFLSSSGEYLAANYSGK